MSVRLMWVKDKFGGKVWILVNAVVMEGREVKKRGIALWR